MQYKISGINLELGPYGTLVRNFEYSNWENEQHKNKQTKKFACNFILDVV